MKNQQNRQRKQVNKNADLKELLKIKQDIQNKNLSNKNNPFQYKQQKPDQAQFQQKQNSQLYQFDKTKLELTLINFNKSKELQEFNQTIQEDDIVQYNKKNLYGFPKLEFNHSMIHFDMIKKNPQEQTHNSSLSQSKINFQNYNLQKHKLEPQKANLKKFLDKNNQNLKIVEKQGYLQNVKNSNHLNEQYRINQSLINQASILQNFQKSDPEKRFNQSMQIFLDPNLLQHQQKQLISQNTFGNYFSPNIFNKTHNKLFNIENSVVVENHENKDYHKRKIKHEINNNLHNNQRNISPILNEKNQQRQFQNNQIKNRLIKSLKNITNEQIEHCLNKNTIESQIQDIEKFYKNQQDYKLTRKKGQVSVQNLENQFELQQYKKKKNLNYQPNLIEENSINVMHLVEQQNKTSLIYYNNQFQQQQQNTIDILDQLDQEKIKVIFLLRIKSRKKKFKRFSSNVTRIKNNIKKVNSQIRLKVIVLKQSNQYCNGCFKIFQQVWQISKLGPKSEIQFFFGIIPENQQFYNPYEIIIKDEQIAVSHQTYYILSYTGISCFKNQKYINIRKNPKLFEENLMMNIQNWIKEYFLFSQLKTFNFFAFFFQCKFKYLDKIFYNWRNITYQRIYNRSRSKLVYIQNRLEIAFCRLNILINFQQK